MASTRGRSSSGATWTKSTGKPSKSSSWRKNLLEYSLASQKRAVEMEPPAPAGEVFGPLLQRQPPSWSSTATPSSGSCASAGKVAVHTPYLRRILDNLSLQHFKIRQPQGAYPGAGPRRGKHAGAVFPQQPKGTEDVTEGTCVGLSSVQAMMEKMGGSSHAEQTARAFQITLVFPCLSDKRDSALATRGLVW